MKRHPLVSALALLTTLATAGAFAQAPATPTLEHCAAIGAPSDRLACYDQLAGRAPAPTASPAQTPLPSAAAASAPPATSLLAAKDAPLPDTAAAPPATSLLS
ncbi:MAG: hypothetical protein ABUL50_13430, partial [Rhizobacter sp.]